MSQFLLRDARRSLLRPLRRCYSSNFSNQAIEIESGLQRELDGILNSFDAPITYAFGYGSGVFKQVGYDSTDKPQIDLILAVEDPVEFHSRNIKQNSHHYSSLKYFGPKVISRFQDVGAGIYFNPYANINGNEVKYGIVSMKRILNDLKNWESFYIAGRLQKPVKVLKTNPTIEHYNHLNLKAAATLAKHLISVEYPEKFDEFQFYKEITGLSYLGDIRYHLGAENPKKVENIVTKNFDKFRMYYKPIYEDVVVNNGYYLPPGFTLKNSLKKIQYRIQRTSLTQMLKGVATAGITKSVKYAWAKRMKSRSK